MDFTSSIDKKLLQILGCHPVAASRRLSALLSYAKSIHIVGWINTNSTPVVHIKIAGLKWIPPKNCIFIGIDPYPNISVSTFLVIYNDFHTSIHCKNSFDLLPIEAYKTAT